MQHSIKQNKKYLIPIMSISFPILVQGTVMQLQSIINRMFLGNIKTEYLATLGNSIFSFYATWAILLAISTGLTILVAQNIGAKKYDSVKEYFCSALLYSSFIALFLSGFWFFFSNNFFAMINVEPSQISMCTNFVKILCIYTIFNGIDMSIQSLLQGIGKTKPIMYSGLFKVFFCILLDWVLIFGKFGIEEKGFYGAALSVTITNIIAIIGLVIYIFFIAKFPFNINIKDYLSPKFSKYKDIIKIGLPTGFETLVWQIGNLAMIRLLNGIGSSAVAIYTLIYSIDLVIYNIYNSIGQSALTLIGHKIGQRKKNESVNVLNTCLSINFVIKIVLLILFIVYSKNILSFFTYDEEIINKASIFLVITAISFFPKSINVITGSGIRAFGDTKWMLYTQIIGTILMILFAYPSVYLFHSGLLIVYIAILFDEISRAIVNIYHFYYGKIKNNVLV